MVKMRSLYFDTPAPPLEGGAAPAGLRELNPQDDGKRRIYAFPQEVASRFYPENRCSYHKNAYICGEFNTLLAK